MSHITNAFRGPVIGILAILALACVGLTACGGSPKASNAAATSSTSASTATSGSSARPAPSAPSAVRPRVGVVRECLKKNGITLPNQPNAAGGPPVGGVLLGRKLPKGVTRAQFQAALQKCAPGRVAGGTPGRVASGTPGRVAGGTPGFRGPGAAKFKDALAKFAACLRQNGVSVPTPNTSGHGPVFSTKGLQTNSPKFREAAAKCRSVLLGAFRAGTSASPGKSG